MSLTPTQKEQCRVQLREVDAKWVNAAYNDSIGRLTITRKWKAGHDRIDSVLEYLNTYGFTTGTGEGTLDTIVDPKMGDETFSGTYRQVKCFDGGTANDAGWVYQELRRVQAPATEIALAALAYLRTQDEAVVRPFGFLHTFSAGLVTTTNGKTWGAAYIFYDLSPTAKATVLGFDAAALVTRLPGANWTYVDRKWEDVADNTGTLVILFQRVEWLNLWGNRRVVAESNPNDTEEGTRTLEAGGISETNLATQYDLAKAVETGKVVEAVSVSEGDKGERTIRAGQANVTELPGTGASASIALTIHLTPAIGVRGGSATRRWKRISLAYKNALVAEGGLARSNFTCPSETGSTSYYHRSVSISEHGNGVYTVTQQGQAFDSGAADVHVDVRGRAVYRKVASSETDPSPTVYVKWPMYRTYHVFRSSWNNCWLGCKAKRGGVTAPKPAGVYPIVGAISVGAYGEYLFKGQVTTFRGWTEWKTTADEVYTSSPDADAGGDTDSGIGLTPPS
jgi:hypothetical protein